MASYYVEKMIGRTIGGYNIIEHLGSEGNVDLQSNEQTTRVCCNEITYCN